MNSLALWFMPRSRYLFFLTDYCIDDKNIFSKINPCIPSEEQFHVFLLDKDNRIILVGNPLKSNKIHNLLIKSMK